jgi:hypothetical protein
VQNPLDRIYDGNIEFHVVGKDALLLMLEGPFPSLFGGNGQIHESAVVGRVEFEDDGGVFEADMCHQTHSSYHADVNTGFEGLSLFGERILSRGTVKLFGDSYDGVHFEVPQIEVESQWNIDLGSSKDIGYDFVIANQSF